MGWLSPWCSLLSAVDMYSGNQRHSLNWRRSTVYHHAQTVRQEISLVYHAQTVRQEISLGHLNFNLRHLYIHNFFIIHLKVVLHSFVFRAFAIPQFPYLHPLVPPLFDRPSNIWRRVTNHEAVIMQLSPFSCYFVSLPLLQHTQPLFFPECDRSNSTLTDLWSRAGQLGHVL
jgi:hypothetical protein